MPTSRAGFRKGPGRPPPRITGRVVRWWIAEIAFALVLLVGAGALVPQLAALVCHLTWI
jgi:hypothetical protein